MKHLIILSSLVISGCMYQSVNENDIRLAEEACKDHGGVQEIHASFNGNENVFCRDNKRFELSNNQ